MRILWALWVMTYNPTLGTVDYWLEACFEDLAVCEQEAEDINGQEHFAGVVSVKAYCKEFEPEKGELNNENNK